MKIRFDPRDCWIGIFWRLENHCKLGCEWLKPHPQDLHIFICIIPCFPIIFTFKWS